jgi:metal-sulfur cluster biosynthetic enzyme
VIALSAPSSSVGWIITASLFLQASCEKIKVVNDGLGALGLLTRPLDAGLVLEMLRSVIDPELGVNIVDLGLVHDVAVDPDGNVAIEMTLTTPGCPLGGFLDDQIRACLAQLPQVRGVAVRLVWEPPWDPTAMSDVAREQLGWA